MRPVLATSLVAAVVSVGVAAYQFMPSRTPRPKPAVPVVSAEPSPYRVIPLASKDGKVISRPETVALAPTRVEDGSAKSTAPQDTVPASAVARPDVLASVARTLETMRDGEAAAEPARQAAPGGLTPTQEDAFRQVAARRKVRPVTRMGFALEPGSDVPAQVYLHPAPPEAAGLSSGPVGFVLVGDRVVVVASDTRKVVAVSGGSALTSR